MERKVEYEDRERERERGRKRKRERERERYQCGGGKTARPRWKRQGTREEWTGSD